MKNKIMIASALGMAVLLSGCAGKNATPELTESGLNPENFVSEVNGKPTALYVLKNAQGMEACITNYGGRIVSLMVPDREGNMRDVVLGFDKVSDYFPENNKTDFGALIGRYANRIDHGRFVLDGDTIQLPTNNYGHCLHGGPEGWQYQVFDAKQENDSTLVLTLHSPDGDSNFPGAVDAKVVYTLGSDNALDVAYEAVTDAPTIINMTNHSYFNLSGDLSKNNHEHILQINASGYTPVDSTFMTTGEIAPVEGTPMDFRKPTRVGDNISDFDFEQIKNGLGFDHNWVLDTKGDDSQPAIVVTSPESGISMTVFTTEPGVQFYSGNFLDGSNVGKNGIHYNQHGAVVLETQHYPDSPNKPQWPTTVLRPGEKYSTHTVFRFSHE